MTERKSTQCMTPEFRVHFPFVWEPRIERKQDGSTVEQYSLCMSFDANIDLSDLWERIDAAGEKKFGEKYWTMKEGRKFGLPIHDGNSKEDPAFKDRMYMNAKSKHKPGIVEMVNGVPEHIIDKLEYYPGVMSVAKVNFFGYDFNGNKGVACGLNNLCKTRDGERLGGPAPATEDFAEYKPETDPMLG